MTVLISAPKAYAGACLEDESTFKSCIQNPARCPVEGYYNDANQNFRFPQWFEDIPQEKRPEINRLIASLSCYPADQWNLGEGLHGLSRKAGMRHQLRTNPETRAFLEQSLIPQVQQYPTLLKAPVIRYYLLALGHALTREMNPLTLDERALLGEAAVVPELKALASKSSSQAHKCELLSLLFLANPESALKYAEEKRLNCYQSAQETIGLMKRVRNRIQTSTF